jgi:hypothetical protein
VPSVYQYPVEKHRDLQRRWGRLLEQRRHPRGVDAGRPNPARPYEDNESTVRYLGIEIDDALAIAEQVDV